MLQAKKTIPDKGVKKINDTTEMVYEFQVLLSPYLHHQNFFAYKIYFRNITIENNTNSNNTNNSSKNESTSMQKNETPGKTNNPKKNKTDSTITKSEVSQYKTSEKHSLKKHVTGTILYNFILILILSVLFILGNTTLKNRYFKK